jgi:hypothetical protein
MTTRRAPFIAVETDLTKDERPAVIADVCGYNVYEARGRLITLWSWCADRRLKDAPEDCDGYAVPEAVIRRFLGPDGVRGILGEGCDELALGALRTDGLIYLRGTAGTVASFRAMQAAAVAGGRARAPATRDGRGQFVSSTANGDVCAEATARDEVNTVIPTTDVQPVDQPDSSRPAAADQPSTSRTPAGTSVDPRSQIPDPRSGDLEIAPLAPIPRRTRAARLLPLAAEWAPRSEELALARSLGVDAPRELAAFRDHHSARGTHFVDWNAAFRTWLRNAVKFSRGGGGPRPSFFEVLDALPPQPRGQA